MQLISSHRCFGGEQRRYQHRSSVLDCEMTFSLYLPPQAQDASVPILYWLSGLTCDDQNFVTKAGAQQWAAQAGIAILAPDTSPRGDDVPDDPEGAYDFGLGAGFYLNATQTPYAAHYRMYDYIAEELPLLMREFTMLGEARAISGHSMGGHGALVLALRNPDRYASVSAFAPICAPTHCPWGEKALSGYLGEDRNSWEPYDATQLMTVSPATGLPIRIDQGAADEFLTQQLQPQRLLEAASENGVSIDYQLREGYDHSYFFIASFMAEHVAFHAEHLRASR